MAAPGLIAGGANTGVRNEANVLAAGQVPISLYDISKTIYLENGETGPLTRVLDTITHAEGHNDRHRWYEDARVDQEDTCAGSIPVDGLTVTVAAGAQWTPQDTLYIHAYNAEAFVSAVVGNVLTLQWVAPPAVAVPAGTTIVRIGNAYEQYSAPEIGPTTIPVEEENVFQDVRHLIAIADQHRTDPSRVTPKDWPYQREKKGGDHALEKEKLLLIGQQGFWAGGPTAGTGHPIGFMQGLYYFCVTNRTSCAVTGFTRPVFDNFLSAQFDTNTDPGQNWVYMTSSTHARYITSWATPVERTQTNARRFGMSVRIYQPPGHNKELPIIVHPLLTRHWPDVGILFNANAKNIRYINHTIWDTKWYTSTVPWGWSGLHEFIRTILTLEFKRENVNLAVIEDVPAYTG